MIVYIINKSSFKTVHMLHLSRYMQLLQTFVMIGAICFIFSKKSELYLLFLMPDNGSQLAQKMDNKALFWWKN